ncbi:hypothetical protein NIES37_60400 [Tolypothrix tenuis PCC 7101]|uniref:Lipoprotein n=1 Tax=Tolypothrix tenuis PCC 7101 TaxID=231146 RepID=A0A1Z4N8P9_9CYAN|nr:hypothetical protein NIES37_60400 [Tolypothrix tenuis PCC 7101]BAZ74045.1 hypothetical protein NIES50_26150 [Aulosira laxa NIES-50]
MKTKSTSIIFLTFISINLILSSCSNPKEASEANFKQALNTILTKHRVGCVPVLGNMESFPITIPKVATEQINQLNSLVKVGFLSSKEGEKKDYSGKSIPGIEYSVTAEGEKFYTSNVYPRAPQSKPTGGFCIGEAEVDKILNFTEPQSYPGSPQVSNVKFTYKFKNLGKWFEDPEVQATVGTMWKTGIFANQPLNDGNGALHKILESKDNPPEIQMNLYLTNNGWVDKL